MDVVLKPLVRGLGQDLERELTPHAASTGQGSTGLLEA